MEALLNIFEEEDYAYFTYIALRNKGSVKNGSISDYSLLSQDHWDVVIAANQYFSECFDATLAISAVLRLTPEQESRVRKITRAVRRLKRAKGNKWSIPLKMHEQIENYVFN